MRKVVAILSLVFSIPIIIGTLASLSTLVTSYFVLESVDPEELGALKDAMFANYLESQVYDCLMALPAIALSSVAVFYFRLSGPWYRNCLISISAIAFFGFPLLSLVSVYMFYLSLRVLKNA